MLHRFVNAAPLVFLFLFLAASRLLAEQPAEASDDKGEAWPSPPQLSLPAGPSFDLVFPEPTSVKELYRVLGQAIGIGIMVEPTMRDHAIELVLNDASPSNALEVLTRTAGHFFTVLDSATILVAEDTPQMRREYDHQVLRSFAPEHAHIGDITTVLRAILGLKHIAGDTEANRIVIRDTAEKVELAALLVKAHDRPRTEVECLSSSSA